MSGSAWELPPYGLTLLAPWWAFILWGGKDIENRSRGVAATVGGYRGRVLLTASKGHTTRFGDHRPFCVASGDVHPDVGHDIKAICEDVADLVVWDPERPPITLRTLRDHAGCIVGTARIQGIYKPRTAGHHRWHNPSQYGLILRDVEYGPVEPATGGQGFWRASRCDVCQRIVAVGSRHRCSGAMA